MSADVAPEPIGAAEPVETGTSAAAKQEAFSFDTNGQQVLQAPSTEEMGVTPWEAELLRYREHLAPPAEHPHAPCEEKTLYFIRHAESMSNVYNHQIKRGSPCAVCKLCCVGFDADISDEGHRQLSSVRAECQKLKPHLQAVLHSPLRRTETTAKATLGDEDPTTPGSYSSCSVSEVPWIPLLCLKEEMLEEHVQEPGCNCLSGHRVNRKAPAKTASVKFRRRIEHFLHFAWDCQWGTFAVVGHSLWFRCMMCIAAPTSGVVSPKNAAVWKLTLVAPAAPGELPRITDWKQVVAPGDPSSDDKLCSKATE